MPYLLLEDLPMAESEGVVGCRGADPRRPRDSVAERADRPRPAYPGPHDRVRSAAAGGVLMATVEAFAACGCAGMEPWISVRRTDRGCRRANFTSSYRLMMCAPSIPSRDATGQCSRQRGIERHRLGRDLGTVRIGLALVRAYRSCVLIWCSMVDCSSRNDRVSVLSALQESARRRAGEDASVDDLDTVDEDVVEPVGFGHQSARTAG